MDKENRKKRRSVLWSLFEKIALGMLLILFVGFALFALLFVIMSFI